MPTIPAALLGGGGGGPQHYGNTVAPLGSAASGRLIYSDSNEYDSVANQLGIYFIGMARNSGSIFVQIEGKSGGDVDTGGGFRVLVNNQLVSEQYHTANGTFTQVNDAISFNDGDVIQVECAAQGDGALGGQVRNLTIHVDTDTGGDVPIDIIGANRFKVQTVLPEDYAGVLADAATTGFAGFANLQTISGNNMFKSVGWVDGIQSGNALWDGELVALTDNSLVTLDSTEANGNDGLRITLFYYDDEGNASVSDEFNGVTLGVLDAAGGVFEYDTWFGRAHMIKEDSNSVTVMLPGLTDSSGNNRAMGLLRFSFSGAIVTLDDQRLITPTNFTTQPPWASTDEFYFRSEDWNCFKSSEGKYLFAGWNMWDRDAGISSASNPPTGISETIHAPAAINGSGIDLPAGNGLVEYPISVTAGEQYKIYLSGNPVTGHPFHIGVFSAPAANGSDFSNLISEHPATLDSFNNDETYFYFKAEVTGTLYLRVWNKHGPSTQSLLNIDISQPGLLEFLVFEYDWDGASAPTETLHEIDAWYGGQSAHGPVGVLTADTIVDDRTVQIAPVRDNKLAVFFHNALKNEDISLRKMSIHYNLFDLTSDQLQDVWKYTNNEAVGGDYEFPVESDPDSNEVFMQNTRYHPWPRDDNDDRQWFATFEVDGNEINMVQAPRLYAGGHDGQEGDYQAQLYFFGDNLYGTLTEDGYYQQFAQKFHFVTTDGNGNVLAEHDIAMPESADWNVIERRSGMTRLPASGDIVFVGRNQNGDYVFLRFNIQDVWPTLKTKDSTDLIKTSVQVPRDAGFGSEVYHRWMQAFEVSKDRFLVITQHELETPGSGGNYDGGTIYLFGLDNSGVASLIDSLELKTGAGLTGPGQMFDSTIMGANEGWNEGWFERDNEGQIVFAAITKRSSDNFSVVFMACTIDLTGDTISISNSAIYDFYNDIVVPPYIASKAVEMTSVSDAEKTVRYLGHNRWSVGSYHRFDPAYYAVDIPLGFDLSAATGAAVYNGATLGNDVTLPAGGVFEFELSAVAGRPYGLYLNINGVENLRIAAFTSSGASVTGAKYGDENVDILTSGPSRIGLGFIATVTETLYVKVWNPNTTTETLSSIQADNTVNHYNIHCFDYDPQGGISYVSATPWITNYVGGFTGTIIPFSEAEENHHEVAPLNDYRYAAIIMLGEYLPDGASKFAAKYIYVIDTTNGTIVTNKVLVPNSIDFGGDWEFGVAYDGNGQVMVSNIQSNDLGANDSERPYIFVFKHTQDGAIEIQQNPTFVDSWPEDNDWHHTLRSIGHNIYCMFGQIARDSEAPAMQFWKLNPDGSLFDHHRIAWTEAAWTQEGEPMIGIKMFNDERVVQIGPGVDDQSLGITVLNLD